MAAMIRMSPALGVNTVRAAAAKKSTRSVRTFAVNAGLGTKHWLPGTEPPSYLDGTMAGDYGTRFCSKYNAWAIIVALRAFSFVFAGGAQ